MRARHPAPVLAIDIGSTGIRVGRFDLRGGASGGIVEERYRSSAGHSQGRIDPKVILSALSRTLFSVYPHGIEVVATSVMWQAVVPVDAMGAALGEAVTWEAAEDPAVVSRLARKLSTAWTHRISGSHLHSSAPLIAMLAMVEAGVFRGAEPRFLDLGSWLINQLTGAKTGWSESIASGSGAWDQDRRSWSTAVDFNDFAADTFGELWRDPIRPTQSSELLPPEMHRTQWLPPLGDGLCHNLGHGAVGPLVGAVTVGTSGSVRGVLAEAPDGPLPDELWRYRADSETTAIGAAVTSAGNALEWAGRFSGKLVDWSFAERSHPNLTTVTAAPDVYGRRGPDYPLDARATVSGLGPEHTVADIMEAFALDMWRQFVVLDGSFRTLVPVERYVVGGGVIEASPVPAQLLADALGSAVETTECPHPSLRGAALYGAQYLRDGRPSVDQVVRDLVDGATSAPVSTRTVNPRPVWTRMLRERWHLPPVLSSVASAHPWRRNTLDLPATPSPIRKVP